MSTVIVEPPWDEHDAACETDDRERGPMLPLTLRIDPVSKALIRYIDGTPHPLDVQHAATFADVISAAPDRWRTMPIPPTARLRPTCVRCTWSSKRMSSPRSTPATSIRRSKTNAGASVNKEIAGALSYF